MTPSSSPEGKAAGRKRLFWTLQAGGFAVATAVVVLIHLLIPVESSQLAEALLLGLATAAMMAPLLWRLFVLPSRLASERDAAVLAAVTGAVGDCIIIIDERGSIRSVNPAVTRIFGYSEQELLGENVSLLMGEPERSRHDAYLRRYLQSRRARIIGTPIEVNGRRKEGTLFPIELTVNEFSVEGRLQFAGFVRDISERKRNEALLASTAQMFDLIFSNIHISVAYLDRHYNFVRVNRLYADSAGRPADHFPGRNYFDLYPGPENERVFRHVIETGRPHFIYDVQFPGVIEPDGGPSWWDWGLHPVVDGEGVTTGLVLSAINTTARHAAEERQARSESRFKTLFELADDAMFILNREGRFIEANRSACERLGYTREELLRMTPQEIDAPESAALVESRVEQLLARGRLVFESENVTREGRRIPTEISTTLIEYDNGPAILAVARDISVRKRALEALEQSEANVRALIDATGESALLVDKECTVLAINKTGAERFGMNQEGIVGRSVFDFIPDPPATTRRKHLERVFATGEPVHFEDIRDGRRLESTIYPILDPSGQVARLAIYANDVTARYQLLAVDRLFNIIDQKALHGGPSEGILAFICEQLVELFDYEFAWIGEKGEGGTVAIRAVAGRARGYREDLERIGIRWDDVPEGRGPTGTAIRSGSFQVARVADIAFAPWREAAIHYGVQSAGAFPLVVQERIFGALTLYARGEGAFSDQGTLERLVGIASRIAVALEMALDQERLQLLGAALHAAGNGIFITDRAGNIEWVNDAFLRLSGYGREEVVGRNPRFLNSGEQPREYFAKLWQTILAGESWCSETRERAKDGSLYTVQQTITPIVDETGHITHFISIHEDITARKATEARIAHMAHHDALTDLPNRVLFYDRLRLALARANREQSQCALLYLDLDHFKQINDTHGHDVGDQLLISVAKRLSAVVRESDTVARLGGDEFTVIIEQIGGPADAVVVAEKILAILSDTYLLSGREIRSGTSIGIALYPGAAHDEDDLVKQADTAMYQAKLSARNSWRLYQPDMGISAPDTLSTLGTR